MRHPTRNSYGMALSVRRLVQAGLAMAACSIALLPASGQVVHRNGFEARAIGWIKGPADAPAKETAHDVTDQTAHTGQLSEHIQLNAEVGTYIHYHYALGRAPVNDELSLGVWIKANRPGTQLMARLVLPRERSADNLNEPLTAMLRGDLYEFVGRWQRLDLRKPVKLMKAQQQLMRAELRRDVDFTDAYIDRLVLNVYGGPGLTEVWIDDLEAGPLVEEAPPRPEPAPRETPGTAAGTPTSAPKATRSPRGATVELNQDHLLIAGKRFLFRAIRHTDTPLKALRDAGFNTVWVDADAAPELTEEAANLGFWIVPSLAVNARENPSALGPQLADRVLKFAENDAVLFWDMGGGRTVEEAPAVARLVQAVKGADPQKPIGADVWDGFLPYSRHLDLVGAHRWPLMTALELPQYREWLNQRRLLSRPGTFQWTWIQTHLPDWYANLLHDRKPDPRGRTPQGFNEPIGPQPEQIRLLTYTALAAGCQGLGFWSDRYLADSHQGRDRLLQLALLNQEIQMLEPMLLATIEPPQWIESSRPEVKAAVMRTDRGVLVLPMWLGAGSQFVPGQAAAAKLTLVVPQVPDGTQAWEVTPGDVRSLPSQRVPGGTKVTLPEFGLTTAIVFTADASPTGLLVRFQDQARRMRKLAAQWTHDLAEIEMEKVLKVEAELERRNHTLPDGQALQDDARARLKRSVDYWNSGDYRESYFEGQRALRPIRILMRAQWEKAIRELDTPVASPYAVSFFTLPRHWEFRDKVQQSKPQANVLPDGDFEVTPDQAPSKWLPQESTIDEVTMAAWRVKGAPPASPSGTAQPPTLQPSSPGSPPPSAVRGQAGDRTDPRTATEPPKEKKPSEPTAKEGERCLKLQVKAKNLEKPPSALERTFLAINSPVVKLSPGTLVRISAWVMIPAGIAGSVDGALIYDSAGGEPLAVRLTGPTLGGTWQRYTLYREVPASGSISVTLALTGLGTVYFDDVRIEPLQLGAGTAGHNGWSRWPGTPSQPSAPQ